jgi:hypothetical protein
VAKEKAGSECGHGRGWGLLSSGLMGISERPLGPDVVSSGVVGPTAVERLSTVNGLVQHTDASLDLLSRAGNSSLRGQRMGQSDSEEARGIKFRDSDGGALDGYSGHRMQVSTGIGVQTDDRSS